MEKELHEFGFIISESKIRIKTDKKSAIDKVVEEIKHQRRTLENYIKAHPDFQYALGPTRVLPDAPPVIQIMTKASANADVGPMAAVAGALADIGLEALLKAGARTGVVEDGGEVAIQTECPITIMILSGGQARLGKIGLEVTREDCPIGIATSSSKTGHAISFGEADSVTAIADTAAMADAAATAVCNAVVGTDINKSIQSGLEKSREIKEIRGAIIIREGQVGLTGRLPRIIRLKD